MAIFHASAAWTNWEKAEGYDPSCNLGIGTGSKRFLRAVQVRDCLPRNLFFFPLVSGTGNCEGEEINGNLLASRRQTVFHFFPFRLAAEAALNFKPRWKWNGWLFFAVLPGALCFNEYQRVVKKYRSVRYNCTVYNKFFFTDFYPWLYFFFPYRIVQQKLKQEEALPRLPWWTRCSTNTRPARSPTTSSNVLSLTLELLSRYVRFKINKKK